MKTVINIKADKEVKEKAQAVARELGLPLGTIINAYLRQFIRSREVYFSSAPQMTSKLEALLKQVETDIRNDRHLSPTFKDAKEMDDYLASL